MPIDKKTKRSCRNIICNIYSFAEFVFVFDLLFILKQYRISPRNCHKAEYLLINAEPIIILILFLCCRLLIIDKFNNQTNIAILFALFAE